MKNLYSLVFLTTGFTLLVLYVSPGYYLIQQERNWIDARAYCQATYTDLAIVENYEDMVRFQIEAQKLQQNGCAWIGLYNDINSWRWSFRNETPGNLNKWMSGEPNNNGGHQECVAMHPQGWTDKECTKTYPFVCFDDSKTGTERYISVSNTMTWLDAQTYCRQHYTDLASTTTKTEYTIVNGIFSVEAWIGLFRDSWKWVDKTKFSTISWVATKPDNKLWNENCGYLNKSQAEDALCSDLKPFLCYLKITKTKQVVRVKIQSNQDMNDTAVKSAILEQVGSQFTRPHLHFLYSLLHQITQKLKDYEMAENSTVRWREQPGGLVFHKVKKNNTEQIRSEKCDL